MDNSLVHFTGRELEELQDLLCRLGNDHELWSLDIAYDPLDKAIKFKPNGMGWSRPYTGRKRGE